MAIDTRDKRASALASLLAPLVAPFEPDGADSAADRQHIGGWIYRGVLAESGSNPTVKNPTTAPISATFATQGTITAGYATVAALVDSGLTTATLANSGLTTATITS